MVFKFFQPRFEKKQRIELKLRRFRIPFVLIAIKSSRMGMVESIFI